MQQPTLAERSRYAFDNYMARGTVALIGGLGAASLGVIVLVALVVVILHIRPGDAGEPLGLIEAAWLSLMRTLDSGTMGGDEGWRFRLTMLVVTLAGVFVISTLIGVLTSGIESQMDSLRKGRSKVIESGHTVILGWSPQIFPIISELILANASQRRSCIVILGPTDKVEMEDAIRDRVGKSGSTRIVCRSGDPVDLTDLALVSLNTCKSIIVLAPAGDNPDSSVIKSILAVTNNPARRTEPYHIVAEMQEARNLAVAKMVGRDEVELLLVGDLISRIVAQTCRQSGLSLVYIELMDFDGDEIYFQHEPRLAGKSFGEALMAYENSAVIGLHPAGAMPLLNPPMNTIIGPEDRIIAISEDDDTVKVSGVEPQINRSAIRKETRKPDGPERTLILGWNQRGSQIVRELDNYVAPGSEVRVVAEHPHAEAQLAEHGDYRNLRTVYQSADTTDRRVLDELQIERYDHIILLCYGELMTAQQADAQTLVSLLHLRDIADKLGIDTSIVSEMLDVRNRQLAEVAKADDFIVSDRLISLMLSAVSENKDLAAVFADIFDSDGSEPYLRPAEDYVQLGVPVNFYTVVQSARERAEVAFGYRVQAHSSDAAESYGVHVNPQKNEMINFSAGDRIVVLAQ
jgi:voltage-gated potassium channel Kch